MMKRGNRSKHLGRFASRLALVAAFALAGVGCISSAKDDTKIGRGESFTSGDPKYDEFFQSVLDVQARVADADGEAPLKKMLAEGLGMKGSSHSSDDIFAAAKTKADAMKSGGGSLYVQILPETKIIQKASKADSEAFTKALEKTVHAGVVKSDELSGIGTQIHDLEAKVEELSGEVDKTFSGDPNKKDDVVKELAAAKDVLERARLKAYAESGRALGFVVGVVRAVDTGGFEGGPIADAGKPQPKPPWMMQGGAAGPKPKPKPKQDFDP